MSDAAPSLTTPKIVFLVVAAAAPMAAMVGNLPLAFALGNGPGQPAAFVLAGAVLLCFAVGYAAMSRRIVNTGAFYTYVAQGLGRPPAVAAAYLAVLSYGVLAIGLGGAFGYFTDLVASTLGLHVPWVAWSGLGLAVTAVLGYRSVDLSARVLGVLMVAEIGVLVVFDLAVLARKGLGALPAESFSPSTLTASGTGGGLGLALMFAFTSFIGFESAALYGEEADQPTRTVPRATYVSVLLIGVFYCLTSWVTVGAIGAGQTRATARREEGNLLFTLATRYASPVLTDVMGLLLCTSMLATLVATHNAASRYAFALGREGLLPAALGRLHPQRYAPATASAVQSGFEVAVVGGFALAGLSPYLTLAASLIGLATLGIVALQALASVAIIVYFRRHGGGDPWRTLLAPAVGGVGLTAAVALILAHYRTLTGTTNPVVNGLPLLLALVLAGGFGYGSWLRGARPGVYAALSRVRLREPGTHGAASEPTHPPANEATAARGGGRIARRDDDADPGAAGG